MQAANLIETIDLARRDFSLVLVSPKQNMLDWLNEFVRRKQLERYRLYIPENNTVLIIPSIDRFSEVRALEEFLAGMKPKLLLAELERFMATPEDFGHPITKETFDDHFAIELRDAASVRFLSDFKY
jgi:hypothetical protein